MAAAKSGNSAIVCGPPAALIPCPLATVVFFAATVGGSWWLHLAILLVLTALFLYCLRRMYTLCASPFLADLMDFASLMGFEGISRFTGGAISFRLGRRSVRHIAFRSCPPERPVSALQD